MPEPAAIVLDWGTSALRAFKVAADGTVLDARSRDQGIRFIEDGAFEPVLRQSVGDWLQGDAGLPVIALGMITSRNGWVEVAYVDCPAGPQALARGTKRLVLADGTAIIFLAGLRDPAAIPFPDVMRGEETQITGFGLGSAMTVVLPGTHSKWVRIEEGRIARFKTFVTGEMFDLLSRHSFIARALDGRSDDFDRASFERGLETAAQGGAGLLGDLFSARTGMLAGALEDAAIGDYLSGLLIGHEFAGARASGWLEERAAIGLVGAAALNERYAHAARCMGLEPVSGPEHAAVLGALEIARAAGVVDAAS